MKKIRHYRVRFFVRVMSIGQVVQDCLRWLTTNSSRVSARHKGMIERNRWTGELALAHNFVEARQKISLRKHLGSVTHIEFI